MSRKPLEIGRMFDRDNLAEVIAHTWNTYNQQRREKIEEWKELRNYIFATDTTKTTNKQLPWKNKTTLPKLCQIRDNLHSNYKSALFPNDEWLRWEGYSKEDSLKEKTSKIQAYMSNKARNSHFITEFSKIIYDYIDYGNCFSTVAYEESFITDDDGKQVIDYIGPKIVRISPMDIVFNPLAASFKDSFKIIRSMKSIGEIRAMVEHEPENGNLKEILDKRGKMVQHLASYRQEDGDKLDGLNVDGFGSYIEYIQGDTVEVLEFYGDIHDSQTQEYRSGRIITVIDRMWVIRDVPIPSWFGRAPIFHAGWRLRPDNLWAMGPLDNLVGLQYRIDHLENLKADAMDLAVLPPLKIIGEVEQFEYGPLSQIHIDENGDVQELAKNAQWVIQANNEIANLTVLMEQFAGAPSEAMGIRTPGEKTMYEVQRLENAAGRIFQEKVNNLEIELLEPSLNNMLETAKRNMNVSDIVRVMDDDLGVQVFTDIKKEDITASGKIRAIGARHFAAQALLMQNLTQLYSSPIGQLVAPHTSSKKLSKLVEDIMGIGRWELFSPNVAVFEQQETQRLMNQAGEDLEMEQAVGPDGIVQ